MSKISKFWLSKLIFYVKNYLNLPKKSISLKDIISGAHFLKTSIFEPLYILKYTQLTARLKGWLLLLGLLMPGRTCDNVRKKWGHTSTHLFYMKIHSDISNTFICRYLSNKVCMTCIVLLQILLHQKNTIWFKRKYLKR